MNPDIFKSRYKAAKARKKTNWETIYREAMELFCPERENFYNQSPGEKKSRQVYTSAPSIALDKASNNLHSSMTPHMKRWVNLKPGRMIPEEQQEKAEESLETITKTVFDNIWASNFDIAISEFYKDLLIGTAALLVTGTPKEPLIFTSVPLHELYISTGPLGTVDTVFRCYRVKAGNIMGTWDDAQLPNDIAIMSATNPEKEIEVVEGTMPKRIKIFNAQTNREEEADGYGYYVCLSRGGENFIVERDMPISPWIVSRWSVLSGEEWGRGPCVISMNDAKTLNQFIKLHMQSMELKVHPMYTVVDDGVINVAAIRTGPGVLLPVSANDGPFGASIAPLASGGDFNAGQIEVQRLEASINEQMYTEPLGPVTLPVKTATEISMRQRDLAKRIGSAYGRLQYELIKPIMNTCLYQLDKYNIINMNNFKVDGRTISIDSVSPLAQGQAQDDINNLMQYVQFAIQSFGPQIGLTLLKPAEIMMFMSENLNLPTDIKFTESDKEKLKQGAEQMLAAQQGQNENVRQQ